MKVSKNVVMELARAIRQHAEEEPLESSVGSLSGYYLDDMILTFREGDSPVFYGLIFQVLGRQFTIAKDLEVLVSATDDSSIDNVYSLKDPAFVERLSAFLEWRTDVLKNHQV